MVDTYHTDLCRSECFCQSQQLDQNWKDWDPKLNCFCENCCELEHQKLCNSANAQNILYFNDGKQERKQTNEKRKHKLTSQRQRVLFNHRYHKPRKSHSTFLSFGIE